MKLLQLTTFAIIITFLIGCTKSDLNNLYVYTWADYIDPNVITQFEYENNCNVIIDTFDDNESAIAKLLAGATGYDIVFPSSYAVSQLTNNNLIEEIDLNRLQNVIANFNTAYNTFLLSTNMQWSVPYAFSMTGLAYRSDKTNCLITSWNDALAKCFDRRLCILNDIREMIGIGLRLNGKTINNIDKIEILNAAKNMTKFKKAARKMDNIAYRQALVSGETLVAFAYNSDINQVKAENPDIPIEFIIPTEGSTCCFDEMVILKSSQNKDLAYKFIDFLYQKDIAKKTSEYNCTQVPVLDANQYELSKEELSKLELIHDVGSAIEYYNQAWDVIKARK